MAPDPPARPIEFNITGTKTGRMDSKTGQLTSPPAKSVAGGRAAASFIEALKKNETKTG